MPVKTDGTLYAKTLKDRQVPDSKRVEAPDAPTGRFIGLGDLKGWDTPCRILEVTDAAGHGVNDAIDAEVSIVIQPQVWTANEVLPVDEGPQLRVGYGEGYFIDIVGVVPPGLPTSEHTEGARGLDHPTQEFMADIPAAHQPFQPGQPALAAIAGAGQHGDPLPDEEKDRRAREAEWQRVYADYLNRHPEDVDGAHAAADAAAYGVQTEPVEPSPAPPTQEDLQAAHARIFQAELEKTPDQPDRALQVANEATGLDVKEPVREDV